jgi:hypothetical protein
MKLGEKYFFASAMVNFILQQGRYSSGIYAALRQKEWRLPITMLEMTKSAVGPLVQVAKRYHPERLEQKNTGMEYF